MAGLLVFFATSGVLVWISRRSLWSVRGHGFDRLLAWECIAGLFCLDFGDAYRAYMQGTRMFVPFVF